MKHFFVKWLCITIFALKKTQSFDAKIWGPGITDEFTIPVQYFFVQPIDANGIETNNIEEHFFLVEFTADDKPARIHYNILRRPDGVIIIRYRLFSPIEKLTIHVTYKGHHIGESPYILPNWMYHEECNCPIPTLKDWLYKMQCRTSYEQMEDDLKPFKSIDMIVVLKEIAARYKHPGAQSFVHYVIKNGKVYRKTFGDHVGFKMFMDATLLSILSKVRLPDFEFIMNLGDWPLAENKHNPIPIVSWCGSKNTFDIVIPTYEIMDATIETMNKVSLDILSIQGNTKFPWSKKQNTAFWRGRDSRQERLDLVKLSISHPEILDAKLTNIFFFKHDEKQLGKIVKHISFFDFFKYKYQVTLDGTVAAYRMPYLLAGDSVILKQDSDYYEHFYRNLKPYVHYIPIKADISDVIEKIQWAIENDEKSHKIAQNAQNFANEFLLAPELYCYHVVLFQKLSKRLVRKPIILDGMELVEQAEMKKERTSDCCHKFGRKDEL